MYARSSDVRKVWDFYAGRPPESYSLHYNMGALPFQSFLPKIEIRETLSN